MTLWKLILSILGIAHRSPMTKVSKEELDERWAIRCIVCNKIQPQNEYWWDTHFSFGICGYTVSYCDECFKDADVCDKALIAEMNKVAKRREEARQRKN